MVPDYPANSSKSKEPQKQEENVRSNLKPVVDAPAKVWKKKENKLLRAIFAQDLKDVLPSLLSEFVEPKIKDLSWAFIQAGIDAVTNCFRMMVYKDYRPVDRAKTTTDRYSYSSYYNSSSYNNSRPKPAPVQTTSEKEVNYDEFTYPTGAIAETILLEMRNQIDRCGAASVLDLYALSDVSTANYALQDWGWTNLNFAEVRQTIDEDGKVVYIIALPKAKPLPR